jgi:hypothetical protein
LTLVSRRRRDGFASPKSWYAVCNGTPIRIPTHFIGAYVTILHVCWNCGAYHADKPILASGPVAICPSCGHHHPFRQLPLLLIGGASGAGKSTICQMLLGQLPQVVLLDSDTLWQPLFDTPEDQYRAFFVTWLRLCIDIGQAGRPVVLFGAGVGVPSNLEPCEERRYFKALHYLALTCDDDLLLKRLQQRPTWRGSHDPDVLAGQVAFNKWYRTKGPQMNPPVTTLDTSGCTIDKTAADVADWIRARVTNP